MNYLVIHHTHSGQHVMKMTSEELSEFLNSFEEDYEERVNVTNKLHDAEESLTPSELLILEWKEVVPECKRRVTEWVF